MNGKIRNLLWEIADRERVLQVTVQKVIAVRKAVSAATTTFTAISIKRCFFMVLVRGLVFGGGWRVES